MKSILLKKTSPLILLFLLIFSVGLFYSFSNSEKPNKKTEYLSIVVNYNINYQLIKITEGTSSFKQIAVIQPDNNTSTLLNWLKKRDYIIIRKEFSDSFDNQYIFELLQQYETRGWELNSHNFAVGSSEGSDTSMSFYLFTK